MATYVNDLRLKEIATGDESGTWGTSTNTNLELIAEAFSYGTEAITTNADTHTTTIADGSTDPGRSMYLKYTGTLDSACTITIGPNTVSKMWFIENGTSGSQNIIISQGSGANITIPPGDVKVVYSDGAGSGAAVVDAFASLSVVDLKVQDDLTVTDDLIVNGDIDLEGSIDVNGTANLDVVDIDGAVDMASTLQVDGAITSSAGATITTADNLDTLSLISTDADANVGPNLRLYRNSGSPADSDALGRIQAVGRNDNSQDVIYSTIETFALDVSDGTEDAVLNFNVMQGGSSVSFFKGNNTEVVVNDDSKDLDFRVESDNFTHALFVQGSDGNVGIGKSSPSAGLHVETDVNPVLKLDRGSANNTNANLYYNGTLTGQLSAANAEFQISAAGSSTPTTFFTNGSEAMRINSSGNVGIKESSPSATLHTNSGTGNIGIHQESTDSGSYISFSDNSTTSISHVLLGAVANDLVFNAGDAEKMRINSSGNVGIGTSSPLTKTTIATTSGNTALTFQQTNNSTTNFLIGCQYNVSNAFEITPSTAAGGSTFNSPALVVNSSGRVGIGETSPANLLHVKASDVGAAPIDTALMVLEASGTNYLSFMGANTNTQGVLFGDADDNDVGQLIYNHSSNHMAFSTAATEAMRIDSSGNLLVGTTSLNASGRVLNVKANLVLGSFYRNTSTTNDGVLEVRSDVGGTNTVNLQIDADGDVKNTNNSYGAISDIKLKENIVDATPKLEKLKQVKVRSYNFKDQPDFKQIGVIAQELETVFPNLVEESPDLDNDNNDLGTTTKSVKYSVFVPMLVKAIQEQQTQIEALQSEINLLKGE
jgi:hypothetical protein